MIFNVTNAKHQYIHFNFDTQKQIGSDGKKKVQIESFRPSFMNNLCSKGRVMFNETFNVINALKKPWNSMCDIHMCQNNARMEINYECHNLGFHSFLEIGDSLGILTGLGPFCNPLRNVQKSYHQKININKPFLVPYLANTVY